MNARKSALKSASVLAAASAALWVGVAAAAPLQGYAGNSTELFASVMRDKAPVEEIESAAALSSDLQRQVVNYPTPLAGGTIVVDTAQTYLYYVLGNGRAIRYGIGVGRDGFTWSGSQSVTRMAEWPDWTPPQEMIVRQPYLPRWMAGGKGNPLGARASYLGSTRYRIHGTNAPETIGTRVSSGCIRMVNADVIDLYSRVTVGTKIVVLPSRDRTARIASPVLPVRVAEPRAADLHISGI